MNSIVFRLCINVVLTLCCGRVVTCAQCAAQTAVGVARAIPATNKILSGVTNVVITEMTLSRCLKRCMEQQYPAFNYGENRCELLNSYLCEGDGALTNQTNHRYYDVETGDLVEIADLYRTENECSTQNRCSPKCYAATTTTVPTTTAAATTTTTTVPTTTAAATTTTTTVPTTTAAATTTTTTVPTTTDAATTTTTTVPTTTAAATTTTTTVPTTTAAATITTTAGTTGPPGPPNVGNSCSINADCTPGVTQCSSTGTCTCVADFSYNPGTNDCVTVCPGGYGSTFTETFGHHIVGYDNATLIHNIMENCMAACNHETLRDWCVSFEYAISFGHCHLASVTKHNHESEWFENYDWDYYQRDCA